MAISEFSNERSANNCKMSALHFGALCGHRLICWNISLAGSIGVFGEERREFSGDESVFLIRRLCSHRFIGTFHHFAVGMGMARLFQERNDQPKSIRNILRLQRFIQTLVARGAVLFAFMIPVIFGNHRGHERLFPTMRGGQGLRRFVNWFDAIPTLMRE